MLLLVKYRTNANDFKNSNIFATRLAVEPLFLPAVLADDKTKTQKHG